MSNKPRTLEDVDREIDHWREARNLARTMANSFLKQEKECQKELEQLGKERSKLATFELGL